jgi:hypothetical protein
MFLRWWSWVAGCWSTLTARRAVIGLVGLSCWWFAGLVVRPPAPGGGLVSEAGGGGAWVEGVVWSLTRRRSWWRYR